MQIWRCIGGVGITETKVANILYAVYLSCFLSIGSRQLFIIDTHAGSNSIQGDLVNQDVKQLFIVFGDVKIMCSCIFQVATASDAV
ncbi:hypothetical protein D9M68_1002090 [compost metagenome]